MLQGMLVLSFGRLCACGVPEPEAPKSLRNRQVAGREPLVRIWKSWFFEKAFPKFRECRIRDERQKWKTQSLARCDAGRENGCSPTGACGTMMYPSP